MASNDGGLPILLIVGLVVAGLLLVAIAVLAVILIMICLRNPQRKKDKSQPARQEDSEMDYCDAYVVNSNTNNKSLPKVNLVWNHSYHKCTLIGCTESEASLKWSSGQLPQSFVAPADEHSVNGLSETLPSAVTQNCMHINIDAPSHDCNDYEEVL